MVIFHPGSASGSTDFSSPALSVLGSLRRSSYGLSGIDTLWALQNIHGPSEEIVECNFGRIEPSCHIKLLDCSSGSMVVHTLRALNGGLSRLKVRSSLEPPGEQSAFNEIKFKFLLRLLSFLLLSLYRFVSRILIALLPVIELSTIFLEDNFFPSYSDSAFNVIFSFSH